MENKLHQAQVAKPAFQPFGDLMWIKIVETPNLSQKLSSLASK